MSKPQRIQLSRAKGWRMPPGAVKVDRSTRWGNPFAPGQTGPMGRTPIDREGAVGFFRAMLADPELRAAARYPIDLSELRGRDLACWCALDQPCHADILIEMANAPEREVET